MTSIGGKVAFVPVADLALPARACLPGTTSRCQRLDTPLCAAVEILAYGCFWLIAQRQAVARKCLARCRSFDLRVLAPSAYYSRFSLDKIAAALDAGVRALGRQNNVVLTFAYKLLDERIRPGSLPHDRTLLTCLDHPARATAVAAA